MSGRCRQRDRRVDAGAGELAEREEAGSGGNIIICLAAENRLNVRGDVDAGEDSVFGDLEGEAEDVEVRRCDFAGLRSERAGESHEKNGSEK